MSARHSELQVVWSELKAVVGTGKKGETRELLSGVSGVARPGELLAIMGPSGAGKTTFLNVLAHEQPVSVEVSGDVFYGGMEYSPAVRALLSYLHQAELIWPELTVQEQLMVNAQLRMPTGTRGSERVAKVSELVSTLGLEKCSGTIIGQVGAGISGGERKRLAVGCELLLSPNMLFADEPTSGLDSYMAEGLIKILRKFSRGTLGSAAGNNRPRATVVTTIHQPSSELFSSFDSLLLFSEGSVAYMGPATGAADLFKQAGCPVPPFTNPADHYLRQLAWGYMDTSLMQLDGDGANSEAETPAAGDNGGESKGPAAKIRATYASSAFFTDMKTQVELSPGMSESQKKAVLVAGEQGLNSGCMFGHGAYNTNYFKQCAILFGREAKIKLRNKLTFVAIVMRSVVLGLFFGAMYYQVAHDQQGVQSLTGAMFMVMINTIFTFLLPNLQVFPGQIQIVKREHQSGMYSVGVYYFSKVFSELPFDFLVVLIFVGLSYPLIGFAGDTEFFGEFLVAGVFMMLIGQSMGSMASSIAPDANIAIAVGVVVVMFAIVPSGFAINLDAVPVYFKWLSEASFMTHIWKYLQISMWENFGELDCSSSDQKQGICTPPSDVSPGFRPYADGLKVLRFLSIDPDDKEESVMILVILILCFRFVALIGTYVKCTSKW